MKNRAELGDLRGLYIHAEVVVDCYDGDGFHISQFFGSR